MDGLPDNRFPDKMDESDSGDTDNEDAPGCSMDRTKLLVIQNGPNSCTTDNTILEAYLVVDYGEQLMHHVDDMRQELQKEIASLREKVRLQWWCARVFGLFIACMVLGLFLAFFSWKFLPSCMAPNMVSTIVFSCTVCFVFLNIVPMTKVWLDVTEHAQYEPKFKTCKCKRCSAKIQREVAARSADTLAASSHPDVENVDFYD